MNRDPFSDVIGFLLQPAWTTGIFWLLLLASIGIAAFVFRTIPGQRSIEHIGNATFRFLIGAMWWQQTLWKLPPYYTDQPNAPFGTTGLAYWMGLMGKHAAIPLQADFVNNLVLPHFYLFAPVVYGLEVLNRHIADARPLCASGRRDRGIADRQSVARALQRTGRMAVDLLLPVAADAHLRAAPLWPQPRARCAHHCALERAANARPSPPGGGELTHAMLDKAKAIGR
jgi:hypothetical protein